MPFAVREVACSSRLGDYSPAADFIHRRATAASRRGAGRIIYAVYSCTGAWLTAHNYRTALDQLTRKLPLLPEHRFDSIFPTSLAAASWS